MNNVWQRFYYGNKELPLKLAVLQQNCVCLQLGNLPARLVNRVTASQPQAVAVLRDKLEALYQADVKSSSEEEMSQLQKEGADLWVELMKAKETRNPPREEAAAECEEKGSLHGWSLVEKQNSDSLQSGSDMEERSVMSVRDVLV